MQNNPSDHAPHVSQPQDQPVSTRDAELLMAVVRRHIAEEAERARRSLAG